MQGMQQVLVVVGGDISDGCVQDDIKNRRKFLRRCEYPGELTHSQHHSLTRTRAAEQITPFLLPVQL